jgi:hypothetical protein
MGVYLLNLAVYRDWGWMDSTALCGLSPLLYRRLHASEDCF